VLPVALTVRDTSGELMPSRPTVTLAPVPPTALSSLVSETRSEVEEVIGVPTRSPAGEARSGASAGSRAHALQSASVADLVEKAKNAEPEAWVELVARFGGMIATTGRRYRLTPADVAELQQTTWLRLVENLHRIEQPERIGGWLSTTARRESLQLLKRAGRYHSGADQMLANLPDRHLPDPDARPIAEEREAVLRAAWGRLKPRCQELLSLLVTDDPMGYRDLSSLLNMPVGSIGPTRARCLEHLRRLVVEEGMASG
jgi:RNA polymerase sigma factor (sigma-70 family)